MVYDTLVRPQLECAAVVWDSHKKVKASRVEKGQYRAARWVSCNYVRLASVTDMIETFGFGVARNRDGQTLASTSSIRLYMA